MQVSTFSQTPDPPASPWGKKSRPPFLSSRALLGGGHVPLAAAAAAAAGLSLRLLRQSPDRARYLHGRLLSAIQRRRRCKGQTR